jgi:hypothetical protein
LAVDGGKNDQRARPYHMYTFAQLHAAYRNILTTISTLPPDTYFQTEDKFVTVSLLPSLLVSRPDEAVRHRHSLLRLLLRFRLIVGCFCFILTRFFLEFDDLHLRSAVDPSHHGSSVLHTLLHVAQWPCVPSGVTSTFAPQSSHFELAMLSMEANNFWCQVGIVV